jgi:site-specific DNA recombinase
MIWNRMRYVKNPDTGRRVSRLNRPAEWVTTEVPHLRIVSDDVWAAAKQRQVDIGRAIRSKGTHIGARRPRYLFSGLTKCGVCGAGFIMANVDRLSCFGAREQGTCSNRLTIRRDEIERRVLTALRDRLLNQELFDEFCDEFTREMNRLRMEYRASLTAAEREIERIEVRRQKLIEMVMQGVPASEVRDEMTGNAARREELKARLAAAAEPPPLLHPSMAQLYRQKVDGLVQALQEPDTRIEAAETLRGLVDEIILTPTGAAPVYHRGRRANGASDSGHLQIELRGHLAAMLSAATNAKRSPESGDLELQVTLVAGAGFEPATFGL